MLSSMKSTKYKTDAAVLAMAIEDMQAAGLIDLKPDKEIMLAPNKAFSLAPEGPGKRDTQSKLSRVLPHG